MSFQTILINHTKFAVDKFVLMDLVGQEAVLVLVNATFVDGERGWKVAEEQLESVPADVYAGDPMATSVLWDSDLALAKPLVDVVVNGTAYAPHGRATRHVPVELRVGDIRKVLRVSGYRRWVLRSPIPAVPFTEMPINYERAFGGTNAAKRTMFEANPVGVGFAGAVSRDALQADIPNIEYPDSLMDGPSDRLKVAGLGPIARWWEPRNRLAGTYDEKYMETRWPVLPVDFNLRFNQMAPADQQSARLVGGEPARLVNLTREGSWEFYLPQLEVPIHLVYNDSYEEVRPRLDTIVIEPDHRRIRMTARLCRTTVRGKRALREIVVGQASQAWVRSRQSQKPFLDLGGTGGGLRPVPPHFR